MIKCPECASIYNNEELFCPKCNTLTSEIVKRYRDPYDFVPYQFHYCNKIDLETLLDVRQDINQLYFKKISEDHDYLSFIEVLNEFKYNESICVSSYNETVNILKSHKYEGNLLTVSFKPFVEKYSKTTMEDLLFGGYSGHKVFDFNRLFKDLERTINRMKGYDQIFCNISDYLKALLYDPEIDLDDLRFFRTKLLTSIHELQTINRDAQEIPFTLLLISKFFGSSNIKDLEDSTLIVEYLKQNSMYSSMEENIYRLNVTNLINACCSIFKCTLLFP